MFKSQSEDWLLKVDMHQQDKYIFPPKGRDTPRRTWPNASHHARSGGMRTIRAGQRRSKSRSL